jgi:hypothetical protein
MPTGFDLSALLQRITDPYGHGRTGPRGHGNTGARTRARTESDRNIDTIMTGAMSGRDPPPTTLSGEALRAMRPETTRARVAVEAARTSVEHSGALGMSPENAPTLYLAQGQLEAEREAASGGVPQMTVRRVAGVGARTTYGAAGVEERRGRPIYEERPATVGELFEQAAAGSGVPLPYLLSTVGVESSTTVQDPARITGDEQQATTSSARGLAGFNNETWLTMVARHGAELGEPELAAAITEARNSEGEIYHRVADDAMRERIFALRDNPAWQAAATVRLSESNARALERRLGRRVTEQDVAVGHMYGEKDAEMLIRAAEAETATHFVTGESLFAGRTDDVPRRNGRSFYEGGRYDDQGFYLGGGTPRTALEVVNHRKRNFRDVFWPEARDVGAEQAAARLQSRARPRR